MAQDYPIIAPALNLLVHEDVTVTHSVDDSSFPFSNLLDPRAPLQWKSSAAGDLFIKFDLTGYPGGDETVTVWGIVRHDLYTQGATIKLQYSTDDISYFDIDSVTPISNRLFLRKVDSGGDKAYYKILIPSGYTSQPKIGHLVVGQFLLIPRFPEDGFDPYKRVEVDRYFSPKSGEITRRSVVYRDLKLTPVFPFLQEAFINSWKNWFDEWGLKPFWFLWDPGDHPNDAVYVELDSSWNDKQPLGSGADLRTLTLNMNGKYE